MKDGPEAKRSGPSGIRHERQGGVWRTGARRKAWILGSSALLWGLFMLSTAYGSSSGGGHEGPNWFDFTWRTINFLILAGVLYWLLAKKIRDFFAGRREGIRAELAQAESDRQEAQKKFKEYDEKLVKATGEIDEITRMIRDQGLVEKERIIADARKTAEKMKEDTRARMEQEFNKASRELRIEAVRLSTQMAAELLRKNIKAEDHEALVKDYIDKVVTKS